MRLVSPNQSIRRQALEDVALGDQTIRAGDALLILAAANRDPRSVPRARPVHFRPPEPTNVALRHGILTASERRWPGWKGALCCRPCSNGGRPFAKPGNGCTPTTSTYGYCVLGQSPHPEWASRPTAVGAERHAASVVECDLEDFIPPGRAVVRRVVDQGRRDLRRFEARRGLIRCRERPSYRLHQSTPLY
jgi:hypothetical protein